MRVLYVIDSLGTGGSERSLAELLPHLKDCGVDPLVACFHRRPGFEPEVRAAGIDVMYLHGNLVARTRALRRLQRHVDPALVHTTLFEANMAGRLAGIGAAAPVLTSLVSTPYVPSRFRDPGIQPFKLHIVRIVDGWTGRHLCDHFHAVSASVRDEAVRSLGVPAGRITVIERGRDPRNLGVPDAARRRAARQRLDLPLHAPVVVNVGRQVYAKGQRYLLQAASQLLARHPELTVLIVGGRGPESDALAEIASDPALAERVRLLGHRDDVAEILAAADVFALPSLFEGFPGAALEAMAMALPVVGSDLGGLRDMLGTNDDWLVAPGKASALADALNDALSRPRDAAAAGARNRERFLAEYTAARSAERMLALYRHLTRSSGPTDAAALGGTPGVPS